MSEGVEPIVVITPKLELTMEQWEILTSMHKENNSDMMDDGGRAQTLTEYLGDAIDYFIEQRGAV